MKSNLFLKVTVGIFSTPRTIPESALDLPGATIEISNAMQYLNRLKIME
jgi:hypothetical protein